MRNTYTSMRLLTSLCLLLTMCVFTACDSDNDVDLFSNWTQKSDFAGEARTGAVSFTINGKAYVGTGSDGENRLSDFWQYNAEGDTWTRLADFPGAARSGAVGFAANGKGYIGTGYDGTQNLKDFWEYDPATDTWTQLADFPGTARYGAVALALEDKGYIGAGFDGAYLKDFWQYDPVTGAWAAKAELSGARRVNGYAFVMNGKGYIGGGRNSGILEADIMEYSPATDSWRNFRNLTTIARDGTMDEDFPSPRAYATAFTLNNKAYIMGGSLAETPSNSAALSDVWEFDPATDTWNLVDAFTPAANRESGVSFVIGNFGYVGLGRSGPDRKDDFWQFDITRSDD